MFNVINPIRLFVLSLIFAQTVGAQTTITILDNEGQPVRNAVLSVKSDKRILVPDQIAIMDQIDVEFVPRVLVVQKGQLVSFPNSDDIRHSVYSFSKPKTFELKLYKGNQANPIPFDERGLVILGCNIHDSMIGYVYVADQELAYKTDEKGQVIIELGNSKTVKVWHERSTQGVNRRVEYSIDPANESFSLTLDLFPHEDVFSSYDDSIDHSSHSNYSGFGKKF
ncbi:methylamine utilization protein [Marinomonas algicola]|uniref:methylamine utilization protein n=1 Tax=Marinomonas algicola TaxID=2773454 RepID=UPI0017497D56|nr:methylamine utilization protein [Marinomonas algicola]